MLSKKSAIFCDRPLPTCIIPAADFHSWPKFRWYIGSFSNIFCRPIIFHFVHRQQPIFHPYFSDKNWFFKLWALEHCYSHFVVSISKLNYLREFWYMWNAWEIPFQSVQADITTKDCRTKGVRPMSSKVVSHSHR